MSVSNADCKSAASSKINKLVAHAQTAILVLITFSGWSERCHKVVFLRGRGNRVRIRVNTESGGDHLTWGTSSTWP